MGIPKFYRWTSERYPCLYEKIREYQIPEFDNLYLDMNGIIHNCSHPNDEDVHLRIPEENIFRDIFHYIDFLFRMIKPCGVFFMAIDGVAPRAKMNQQRGRRFRSARVAEEQEAEAIRQGEKLPTEERFDSNCITPGTEFMARLHEQLKYFVSVKISTDPLWQRKGLKVYLSGHDVPGEGEHKIMDFIRHIRSKDDYDAETRHCLYGLDADLMMLGLSTHELRFSLLREEVKFTRPKKKNKPAKNHQQKRIKPKENKAHVPYDFTNVSVFSTDNILGVSDTILKPISANNLSINGFVGQKTFVDAVNVPKLVPELTALQQQETLAAVDSTAPPPPAEDQNAKGDYKAPLPEKTSFFLLHLSLFRDYLDEEFLELRKKLENHPFIKYNLECLIDDWILMNILVGNDFVPHLPNLHIVKGALPMLYRTYMDVLPTLDGYLNESGILNLGRFETFIRKLSLFDLDQFRDTYDDMKYKASKTGKNIVLGEKMFEDFIFEDDTPFEEDEIQPISDELKALAQRTEDEIFGTINNDDNGGLACKNVFPDDSDFFASDDTDEFRLEFQQHKRNYYLTKCEFKKVDSSSVNDFAREYIRAIQWVLLYYYKGVSSWGWFYPSHYAPYASDLRCFKDYKIQFNKGLPFKPFEQLLAVLPSQSKRLLPNCYQWLMIQDESPILEYYPKKFELDLNGKRQDWEAVVLIPFIDEEMLLSAMTTAQQANKMTEEEVFRNERGNLLVYTHSKQPSGPIKSHRDIFPELETSYVHLEKVYEVGYDPLLLPNGIHPKADIKKIYQGFPSLKSKTFTSCVCKAEVKVFEFFAREESLILSFEDFDEEIDGLKVGKKVLGKTVWVNWPHLESALVIAVYTPSAKYILGRDNIVIRDPKTTEDSARKSFAVMAKGLVDRHLKFRGIRLGSLKVVLKATVLEGRKIRCNNVGKVVIENQWSKVDLPFALKTTIFEERVTEMFYMDQETAKSYLELFRIGDQVFYLGDKMFGAMGVVSGHDKGTGSVVVDLNIPKDSDESNLKEKTGLNQLKSQDFFPPYVAAAKCQISSFALSRLTGRVLVLVEKPRKPRKKSSRLPKPEEGASDGASSESSIEEDFPMLEPETHKVNIGLDLKFNKTNQEVKGYTSKRDGQWWYSANTIALVNEYANNFPDMVELLGRSDKNKDVYNASDIFPKDPYRAMEIVQWLEDKGVKSLPVIPTNCSVLDDDDIDVVWNHVVNTKVPNQVSTVKQWTVRPNLLYKPGLDKGCIAPIPNSQFSLLDRVVCVDRGASVQFGTRGTVIGVQTPPKLSNDDDEESFKCTSADAVNSLIILCDPAPDLFDFPNKNSHTKNGGDLTELTGSLAKLLGLNDKPAPENTNSECAVSNFTKAKPKLVKLFPYQVINLTQGTGSIRQDFQKSHPQQFKNDNTKSSLRNGTVIVKNYAKAVTESQANRNTMKVLQRPGSNDVKKQPVQNQRQPPKPVVQSELKLPWPPQPMNRSITVEQLFAEAAKSKCNNQPDAVSQNSSTKSKLLSPSKSVATTSENNSKQVTVKKSTDDSRSKGVPNVVIKKRQHTSTEQDEQSKLTASSTKPNSTKIFVNSALSKGQAKENDKFVHFTGKSEVKSQPIQNNQLLDMLCKPKNIGKVHANDSGNKNKEQISSNDFSRQKIPTRTYEHHVMGPSVPVPVPVVDYRRGMPYPHQVVFVPQQDYYVPTLYPVMPGVGQSPYASAFTPPFQLPLENMFPPPQPPHHWTQMHNNQAHVPNQSHLVEQNQSVRKARGTHTSNVFVPLQVSRSMAGPDGSGSVKRKENKKPIVDNQSTPQTGFTPSQPSAELKDTVPATNTLKALLGVTKDIESESLTPHPQARKSRIAANFSFNSPGS